MGLLFISTGLQPHCETQTLTGNTGRMDSLGPVCIAAVRPGVQDYARVFGLSIS